jgi:hypothetical protein
MRLPLIFPKHPIFLSKMPTLGRTVTLFPFFTTPDGQGTSVNGSGCGPLAPD